MEIDVDHGKKLRVVIGDITKIRVDAMVNAANSSLAGGGGVDGAIHRAGGPSLMKELDRIRATAGECPPGKAVVTSAGALPARFVFHAVGLIYHDGTRGEPEQLASCYHTCLELADQGDVRIISFPAISTGAYRYPLDEAAEIATTTVRNYLLSPQSEVREVLFVMWDQRGYDLYAKALGKTRAR